MERILHYLVALSTLLRVDGQVLPGWWVGHDPHRRFSADYRGGHGNLGLHTGSLGRSPYVVAGMDHPGRPAQRPA